MAVKHNYRTSQSVISSIGEIELDEKGVVTNADDLTGGEEALLKLPNFVEIEAPKPAEKAQTTDTSRDGSDDEILEVIKALKDSGAKTNSAGYLDMGVLNSALREKGLKVIPGGKRIELEDSLKSPTEETSNEGATDETTSDEGSVNPTE